MSCVWVYLHFLLADSEDVFLSMPCTGRDTVGCFGRDYQLFLFGFVLSIENVLNSTHKYAVDIFTNSAERRNYVEEI